MGSPYPNGQDIWNQRSVLSGRDQQQPNSLESPYPNGLDIWGQPSVTTGNKGYQQTNDALYALSNPNYIPGTATKPIAMQQGYGGMGVFGRQEVPGARPVPQMPSTFGSMFQKMGDKTSEWFGKQGIGELANIGLNIKDQFFDRPKMINAYLDQSSSLNQLRGVQMAALNENIAGAKRNEAALNKRTAAFDYSQRPASTSV